MIHLASGSIEAVIATETGNQVRSLKCHPPGGAVEVPSGHEILWMPTEPNKLGGIPFLAPWANRLDGDSYSANGKRYCLNPNVTHIRRDGHGLPIHGLLAFCQGWQVVSQSESSVTSRLDFFKHPGWMAQFPFAHTIEITHRIVGDSFAVETAIENLATEPMPLCIGFHPYFQLTDTPRDEWNLTIPASQSVVLSDKVIPTGEVKPSNLPRPLPLSGTSLDSVFTGLTGEAFVAEGRAHKISVKFGPKYPVAIVYAPAGQPYFCFEPMSALTNAFNLPLEQGLLQHIAPGEIWRESFWIRCEART